MRLRRRAKIKQLFDPETTGFIRLRNFQIPVGIDIYELRNHAVVDGMVDMLRINIYMSKDGSFITIWNGLVEPMLAEGQFDIPDLPSFQVIYCETLFRGHIECNEEALVILTRKRSSY